MQYVLWTVDTCTVQGDRWTAFEEGHNIIINGPLYSMMDNIIFTCKSLSSVAMISPDTPLQYLFAFITAPHRYCEVTVLLEIALCVLLAQQDAAVLTEAHVPLNCFIMTVIWHVISHKNYLILYSHSLTNQVHFCKVDSCLDHVFNIYFSFYSLWSGVLTA